LAIIIQILSGETILAAIFDPEVPFEMPYRRVQQFLNSFVRKF
jgi:hypothetical protein